MASRRGGVLPGFGLAMGFTLLYLVLIILIPLSTIVLKTASLSPGQILETVTSERALASFRLSFGAAFAAALINAAFGLLVAWVLERYHFPGKKIVDSLVDLPFALPTAVAGIALTTLYSPLGWLGRFLEPLGLKVAYSPLGVIVALTFVGLPFVVRTVQPVLANIDVAAEEAAASLGAGRFHTLRRILFPEVRAALVAGSALAFARALGEYGSIVFISGNMPMKTEITPLLIMIRLEEFDYAGATSIALVFLSVSFLLLLLINLLTWRTRPVRMTS